METSSLKKENVLPFALIFIFILITAFLVYNSEEDVRVKRVRIGGQNIRVELALTPEERTLGLSGRDALGDTEGMLFVFPEPGEYLFWMKGMNFPIDIIWIDEKKQIIYVKTNALPENYLETYGPEQDAKYVLEVSAGFSEKNNVKVGDKVRFTY
jgi:uncharacterized protein